MFKYIKENNFIAVKKYVEQNNDISNHCLDTNGDTILATAIKYNNIYIAKYLIANKCNINSVCEFGRSILHIAATKNNSIIINYLIHKGANIHAVDNYGNLPMHLLCTYDCDLQPLKLMIKGNVDITKKNNVGENPLIIACKNNRVRTMHFLLNNCINLKINSILDKCNRNLLHLACFGSSLDMINLVIYHGVDINAQDCYGNSALHIASKLNKIDMIFLLNIHNCNKNLFDNEMKTPLNYINSQTNNYLFNTMVFWGFTINVFRYFDGEKIINYY